MSKFILRMKEMTAQSDKDLCPSCTNVYQRTDNLGTVRTCSMASSVMPRTKRITGRVTDCTDYYPKDLPSLGEMKKIAWEITTDKKTQKVGFISPADRRGREPLSVPGMDDEC